MKTIQELEKMTDEELRVMLAELTGWTNIGTTGNHGVPYGRHPEPSKRSARTLDDLPDYLADLNACHAVVMSLTPEQRDKHESLIHNHYLSLSMLLAMDARKATCFLIATLQAQPPHKPLNTTV